MPNRTRRPKIQSDDLQVAGLQQRKDVPMLRLRRTGFLGRRSMDTRVAPTGRTMGKPIGCHHANSFSQDRGRRVTTALVAHPYRS